jgi:hypothetical protein
MYYLIAQRRKQAERLFVDDVRILSGSLPREIWLYCNPAPIFGAGRIFDRE